MYNHNKAQQSKNRVHISWDILYAAENWGMTAFGNLLSVVQHNAIIGNSEGLLLTGHVGTKLREISNQITKCFSFYEDAFEKCWPFFPGLHVWKHLPWVSQCETRDNRWARRNTRPTSWSHAPRHLQHQNISILDKLNFFEKTQKYIAFSNISQYGDGSWNVPLWKTRTCLLYKINTIVTDDLATQRSQGISSHGSDLVWLWYFS